MVFSKANLDSLRETSAETEMGMGTEVIADVHAHLTIRRVTPVMKPTAIHQVVTSELGNERTDTLVATLEEMKGLGIGIEAIVAIVAIAA